MLSPRWISLLVPIGLAFVAGCSGESATDALEEGTPTSVGFIADDVPGRTTGPHCTGTLVAPRVVLTAAHCILSPEEAKLAYTTDAAKYGVSFGLGNANGGNRIRAAKVVIHPAYDSLQKTPTDLAYLVLERDVPHGVPAKLAVHDEGCDYETLGYGPTTRADGPTGEMSRTRVCATKGFDAKGFIRATSQKGSVCYGFGGGPLVAPQNGEVMGVLSWGEAWCAEETDRPSYFIPFEHPNNVAFVKEALSVAP